ncbi:unnamed protein product [Amoebophrya sp. A25]|nr:unnamed protein product [Amoebophrya sp. A25]|eukprot:GSA25T00009693001.1
MDHYSNHTFQKLHEPILGKSRKHLCIATGGFRVPITTTTLFRKFIVYFSKPSLLFGFDMIIIHSFWVLVARSMWRHLPSTTIYVNLVTTRARHL